MEASSDTVRRWNANHPRQRAYIRGKSAAKIFVLQQARPDDLQWLANLIQQRQKGGN